VSETPEFWYRIGKSHFRGLGIPVSSWEQKGVHCPRPVFRQQLPTALPERALPPANHSPNTRYPTVQQPHALTNPDSNPFDFPSRSRGFPPIKRFDKSGFEPLIFPANENASACRSTLTPFPRSCFRPAPKVCRVCLGKIHMFIFSVLRCPFWHD